MRLLGLEIKRVLRTKVTWILICAALILSVLLAYIPVTFEGGRVVNGNGTAVTTELKGMDAVRYYRENSVVQGEVTPEILQEAIGRYQEVYAEYNSIYGEDVPAEVYYERLRSYSPFIRDIKEAFSDRKNGMAPAVTEIPADEVKNFYLMLNDRLSSIMDMEQGNYPSAKTVALNKFSKVQTPYTYYYGASSDSMDYQTIFIFLITILCAVIVAPVFSTEYQTGADDIIRCTKNGRMKIAIVKIVSAGLITGILYLLCGTTWIVVTNSLFGWEGMKTSMQILFSATSLLPYNIGQLQWANMLGGFLLFLSTVSFTLLLSAVAKNNVSALALSLVFVLLPVIVYMAVPGQLGDWIQALLPGAGIGLSNSLLYGMMDFDFLHIGSASFWNTDVMLVLALVKIPLFLALTVLVYDRKRIRN